MEMGIGRHENRSPTGAVIGGVTQGFPNLRRLKDDYGTFSRQREELYKTGEKATLRVASGTQPNGDVAIEQSLKRLMNAEPRILADPRFRIVAIARDTRIRLLNACRLECHPTPFRLMFTYTEKKWYLRKRASGARFDSADFLDAGLRPTQAFRLSAR